MKTNLRSGAGSMISVGLNRACKYVRRVQPNISLDWVAIQILGRGAGGLTQTCTAKAISRLILGDARPDSREQPADARCRSRSIWATISTPMNLNPHGTEVIALALADRSKVFPVGFLLDRQRTQDHVAGHPYEQEYEDPRRRTKPGNTFGKLGFRGGAEIITTAHDQVER